MRALIVLLSFIITTIYCHADDKFVHKVFAQKSNEIIQIDGELSENIWHSSEQISRFWEHWPLDSVQAEMQTTVNIAYDDKNLYIGAICYDDPSKHVIQSLKRDNRHAYWQSDGLALILDPQKKSVTGYMFAVNAAGSQIEGLISQNGEWYKMDENWNSAWEVQVKHHPDYWTVEMAIPFKSISYDPENTVWGINFLRNDMKRNNYSTWTRFSNNFQGIDLSHTGDFVINELPEIKKNNFILIPSAVAGYSKDFEENETLFPTNLGIDSKMNLGTSLRLDMTVNPDFSQVEIDEQITNLSRFNPYFPEKRNFFLENSDLFSNLGTENVRPVFTRRIGLYEGENIPILFGARLSGNLTENARIGIMNVQTLAKNDVLAQNYLVSSFQQSILKRSNVKVFMANRQAINNLDILNNDFNRLGGLELNYFSENSRWLAGAKLHHTQTNAKLNDNNFYALHGGYKGDQLTFMFNAEKVQENYISDIGFVPRLNNYDAALDTTLRLGYTNVSSRLKYKFMLKDSKFIYFIEPRLMFNNYYNDDGSVNESNYMFTNYISFADKSWLYTQIAHNETNLPFPITLINDSLLIAKSYNNHSVFNKYHFDPRKTVNGEIFFQVGKFYDGVKYTFGGVVNYRTQPWGNFGISYTQNNVQLGEIYGNKVFHLIGPKTEISFSKDLSWTSFLQYNTQAENFNINTRLQWRFRPMSDIYLVFTNNYNSFDEEMVNYGITFKLNYWINA